MIENGTVLQNRYLIEKQIGAGGMGAVYLAVDQRFDNYVAIKETFYQEDEFGEAFEREARLLNSLMHPVLPHVSDFFVEGGEHFLVMQYIEGEDMSDVLKRRGAFPVTDVLRWTNNLLDALDYLHSQEPPIIHRDIKPQNLKVNARGDVFLLDFGLAKLNYEDTSSAKSVFGYSRKYSPLEQIQGTGTDARSDIFSLGATVYHLLTGKPPVDSLTRASAIVAGNPDPLPLVSEINSDISENVASVLNTALALNSASRFVSSKAARQALEHAIEVDGAGNSGHANPTAGQSFANAPTIPNAVVSSPEAESFPALESFAAAVEIAAPDGDSARQEIKIDSSNDETPLPATEVITPPIHADVPTQISHARPVRSQNRFPALAAAVVLVILAGIAGGYLINRNSQPQEANQTAVEQTSSETDVNAAAPTAPVSGSSENVEQATIKPSVVEKTSVKQKPNEEATIKNDTTEIKKPEIVAVETAQPGNPRPSATKNSRRDESLKTGEARTRVVTDNAPASDIESIFTGQPAEPNEKRQNREERLRRQAEREIRETMTEEEWQEMRRQRREERQRRRNSQRLPF